MLIFPAIDIKDGSCVRLRRGDFDTVHKVAEDPLKTALSFKEAGAEWIHMVDLDGAKTGRPVNTEIFKNIAKNSGLKLQLGGGIRDMSILSEYMESGVSRAILGSAAVKNPEFVREAVREFGDKIAVGIDAKNGRVATEGWLDTGEILFTELAKGMEDAGVQCIIFTDISRDGLLSGPNFEQLCEISGAVSCKIIASGGVTSNDDIIRLREMELYGAICGKALYTGDLDLEKAVKIAAPPFSAAKLFEKSPLIPAIIQEEGTGEVLMLAYMNRESFEQTLREGCTCFYSRSRQELWTKGETSGHYQKVVSVQADCDFDTLLIKVKQTGAACHTGEHSCFLLPGRSFSLKNN